MAAIDAVRRALEQLGAAPPEPLPAPGPSLSLREQLDAQIEEVQAAALRPNTLRSYADQWRAYERWCVEHTCATHQRATVRAHLSDLALRRPGSVRSRYAAICHVTGLGDPELRGFMQSLRRGYRPESKDALSLDLLDRLVVHIRGRPSPKRERDLVVLLCGYFGTLRRSELSALDWSDVIIEEDRARLRIRRSKTSRRPETVVLRARADRLCPVAALRSWSGFGCEGPVLRCINRAGGIMYHRGAPVPRMVSYILKEHLAAIGIDSECFASHSLRSGGLTAMHLAGASDDQTRRHARHSSERRLATYIRADAPRDFSEAVGV